jgi:predicted lactoylglutathione lyase
MPVELNHTIVEARDKRAPATFLATLIGLQVAFLVSEDEFDTILALARQAGLTHYAINHNDGGRGTNFDDPDGHNLEILTRPYDSA